MADMAFDTLHYARRLKAVGVPEQQAEVQAELMAEAFGFYVNNLVTRDYLDARFAEQDACIDLKFARLESTLSLHNWMLGAILAATVLPALSSLLNG